MSGGVVWAWGELPSLLGKWSARFTLAAGAVPPGTWILGQAGTLTTATGQTITVPANTMIESDGQSLTTTAGHGTMLGSRPMPIWPWPKPWPLSILPA